VLPSIIFSCQTVCCACVEDQPDTPCLRNADLWKCLQELFGGIAWGNVRRKYQDNCLGNCSGELYGDCAGKIAGELSEECTSQMSRGRIRSLYLQQLWFQPPWLTHRHTDSFWPVILLAQRVELKKNENTGFRT